MQLYRPRRKLTDDQLIERFDKRDPNWVKGWSDEKLAAERALAHGDRPPPPAGTIVRPPGYDPRPDVNGLARQLADERERAHGMALVENLNREHRAEARRRAVAWVEARRLRQAGYELADVEQAAQRARDGLPPLSPDEVEQREQQRADYDDEDVHAFYRDDAAAEQRHRERLADLDAWLNGTASELQRARFRLTRMGG